MDNRVYWIWLQHAFGPGSPMPWRISLGYPGGVEGFFRDGSRVWNSMAGIKEREAAALYAFSLSEAQAQLEYADKVGWQVLTPECEKYPAALRNIFDPPAVLYVRGQLPDVDRRPTISVVGARKALKESEEKGKEFGYQLAIGGAVVVTGGAVGIDTAATLGAMSGEGPLISVLPVALNSPYLVENAFLRETILEKGGALVSEFFSQQSPGYGAFHMRNRLITGFACGVLLIQAARKSGTIIYASYAKDQDRDVFVYPGKQGDPAFAGGWDLIADGAKPVTCGEEILEEYDRRFHTQGRVIPLDPLPEVERNLALADPGARINGDQAAVLAVLEKEAVSVGTLAEQTGLPTGNLLALLAELELRGLVKSHPGKRYSLAGKRVPSKGSQSRPRKEEREKAPESLPLPLRGEEAAVLSVLREEPQSLSQLEEETGLAPGALLGILTELELGGVAKSHPGKRYSLGGKPVSGKGAHSRPRKEEREKTPESLPLSLRGEEAAVLSVLGEEPQSLSQLEEETGLASGALLGILTELELRGLAKSLPGKRYRLGEKISFS